MRVDAGTFWASPLPKGELHGVVGGELRSPAVTLWTGREAGHWLRVILTDSISLATWAFPTTVTTQRSQDRLGHNQGHGGLLWGWYGQGVGLQEGRRTRRCWDRLTWSGCYGAVCRGRGMVGGIRERQYEDRYEDSGPGCAQPVSQEEGRGARKQQASSIHCPSLAAPA